MEPVEPIAIVMMVYNDFFWFKKAADSIIENTEYPYKLIIIESESTDGSAEYADLLPKIYPDKNIQIVHTKKEGSLQAYILGAELSKPYDVYFTQTDTYHPRLLGRDWLSEIARYSKNEDCGFISSLDAIKWSGPEYFGIPYVGGWSLFIPRRILDAFGFYDTNFLIGDAVDIEHTYRVLRKGFVIYTANFWVDHHRMTAHSGEDRPDLEDIKIKNRIYFREKYKGDKLVVDGLRKLKNTLAAS